MSIWIHNEDDTEWTCKHCGLKVTADEWGQVMLYGTSSFPQCTGECEPKGMVTLTGPQSQTKGEKGSLLAMANIILGINPLTEVDYSIKTGRIRSYIRRGTTLYDEGTGISEPGWQEDLRSLVRETGLDVDRGQGLFAFVRPLMAGKPNA